MKKCLLFVFASFISMTLLKAQDSTTKKADSVIEVAGVKITGSVDVYYRYNFSNPKTGFTNNYTSFTNSQNSFELGMASLQASHSFGKATAFADLGFGRRAEEFNYPDGEKSAGKDGFLTLAAVKQLYVSYAISDKFKLTMGKWATHIGYELADAYLNRNYSMDYMFSYGPFSHTGVKA
ncbi:MAG: porin, partial [Bacteroidota bacterium]|nr:porin [Bacteroidota bacterium]